LNLNCWNLLRNVQLESLGTLISVNFQQFSIFPEKNPNFGVFGKNLSKVRLRKMFFFSHPFLPAWLKETQFHCYLVGTKFIVDLFWQALVKVIPWTLERDELN